MSILSQTHKKLKQAGFKPVLDEDPYTGLFYFQKGTCYLKINIFNNSMVSLKERDKSGLFIYGEEFEINELPTKMQQQNNF